MFDTYAISLCCHWYGVLWSSGITTSPLTTSTVLVTIADLDKSSFSWFKSLQSLAYDSLLIIGSNITVIGIVRLPSRPLDFMENWILHNNGWNHPTLILDDFQNQFFQTVLDLRTSSIGRVEYVHVCMISRWMTCLYQSMRSVELSDGVDEWKWYILVDSSSTAFISTNDNDSSSCVPSYFQRDLPSSYKPM